MVQQAPTLQILVVEDNLVNQQLASSLLQKEGHQVVVAGNGREALAVLACQPFDLVLMDVQMPEMDGLEATAAIRASERGTDRHLPIVALTSLGQPADRDVCLQAGMDGHVTKPLHMPALRRTLAEILSDSRMQA
jgi:CheY-like chemotaxis protein